MPVTSDSYSTMRNMPRSAHQTDRGTKVGGGDKADESGHAEDRYRLSIYSPAVLWGLYIRAYALRLYQHSAKPRYRHMSRGFLFA